ncbi:MAG: CRISPR-associated endoribonuclease Cas6 [Spirosomaceae bacterium]|jgi:CRISPR-associated endoribonuclease Cas6|nr:CRISPR-associated endoribonuclease Cas6 [Spirosomataceae bacterium]
MRFKLYLRPVRDRQKLLFNYQYPLQAWLYAKLAEADADYATFLHGRGYSVPNSRKTFKHFTFSSLHIPKAEPVPKGQTYMQIRSETISLLISFYVDKAAEDFVMGLFKEQQLSIYNRDHRADFVVERVEAVPPPLIETSMVFRTISPLVVARKTNSHDQYLNPAVDADFGRFFAVNLIDKFRSIQPTFEMDADTAARLVKFELLSDPDRIKKRGFLAKETKTEETTKVIGYHNFTFALTAPTDLIEVGYWGGFGKFCAMGCGCVDVATNKTSTP